ncbi:hypothetical protein J6590_035503 [Homalodisca vitripennis]|nr:hypothetical protein J6590_035503 [Homalodisca vitripennis]
MDGVYLCIAVLRVLMGWDGRVLSISPCNLTNHPDRGVPKAVNTDNGSSYVTAEVAFSDYTSDVTCCEYDMRTFRRLTRCGLEDCCTSRSHVQLIRCTTSCFKCIVGFLYETGPRSSAAPPAGGSVSLDGYQLHGSSARSSLSASL